MKLNWCLKFLILALTLSSISQLSVNIYRFVKFDSKNDWEDRLVKIEKMFEVRE